MTMYWKRLLESDLSYCTICRIEQKPVRVRVPVSEELTKVRLSSKGKGPFVVAKRAAFRRHVAENHPDWMTRLRWVA